MRRTEWTNMCYCRLPVLFGILVLVCDVHVAVWSLCKYCNPRPMRDLADSAHPKIWCESWILIFYASYWMNLYVLLEITTSRYYFYCTPYIYTIYCCFYDLLEVHLEVLVLVVLLTVLRFKLSIGITLDHL